MKITMKITELRTLHPYGQDYFLRLFEAAGKAANGSRKL